TCITTIEKIISTNKSHGNLIKPIKNAIFISLEKIIATKNPNLLVITAKLLSHIWFSKSQQAKKRNKLLKDVINLMTTYLLSNSRTLDLTIAMLNYLNSITKIDFKENSCQEYQLQHTAIQMKTLDLIVDKIDNDRELAANHIEHFISLTDSLPKKTLQGVEATRTLNNALNVALRLEKASKAKLQKFIIAKLTDKNIEFLFENKLLSADLCNIFLEHIKDNYEQYPSHPIFIYQLITFLLKTEESLKVKVELFMKFAFLLPSESDRAIHEHKQFCLAIFTRIFTLFNSDFDENDRIQLGLIFTFLMEKVSSEISKGKYQLQLIVKDPAATVYTIIEKILENPSNAAKHFAVIFLISIEVDSFLKNSIDLLPSYKMLINYVKDDALIDLSQETAQISTLSLREIATEFCSNLGYREKYKTDSCPKALAKVNNLIVEKYMYAIRKSINGSYLTWITNIEYLKNFITTVNQFNIIDDNAKTFRKNMCNLLNLSSSKKSLNHYLLYLHIAKGLSDGIIMSAETESDIQYIAARFTQYICKLCKKTTKIDDVILLKNLFLHIKDSFVKIPSEAIKELHKICLQQVHRVKEYKHFKNIEEMREL
ncbi:MAG: hypothetical protein VX777_09115, partial [Chlamydiota bacterium]|nr:hypothetical protein [Chlamydiota bacterium]